MERFLPDLACRQGVSASTQNQALCAILCFYQGVLGQTLQNINALRANRPAHMRRAPTIGETQAFFRPSATTEAIP
jgi:hypothetical protein